MTAAVSSSLNILLVFPNYSDLFLIVLRNPVFWHSQAILGCSFSCSEFYYWLVLVDIVNFADHGVPKLTQFRFLM